MCLVLYSIVLECRHFCNITIEALEVQIGNTSFISCLNEYFFLLWVRKALFNFKSILYYVNFYLFYILGCGFNRVEELFLFSLKYP